MGKKVIISGGGTGGHIFPAISIANALKDIQPDIEILFVGALGKMEMERVPSAGYPIKGLPVAGLKRSLSLSNLTLPFKVLKSVSLAGKIIDEFKPDVVVGVGGYASAPLLWSATSKKIPCLIQEQNSYAGLTNKILGKKVDKICVAYDGMEKFFPKDKILFTGNPIRKEIRPAVEGEKETACKYFNISPDLPTVLIVGGSLGSGTLNRTLQSFVKQHTGELPYQILWQSGKGYKNSIKSFFEQLEGSHTENDVRSYGNIRNFDFISRMDLAFAASDIIVSRAGAGTISELCAAGKASIFVPSPNVAEDHQTHNAMALVHKEAAIMVKDVDAQEKLMENVEKLLSDKEEIKKIQNNILKLSKIDAAKEIAEQVLKLMR